MIALFISLVIFDFTLHFPLSPLRTDMPLINAGWTILGFNNLQGLTLRGSSATEYFIIKVLHRVKHYVDPGIKMA